MQLRIIEVTLPEILNFNVNRYLLLVACGFSIIIIVLNADTCRNYIANAVIRIM